MKNPLPRKRKWMWLGALVVVVAIAIAAFFLLSGEDPVPVQAGKITKGELRQIVSASGNIDPAIQVEISANISAEITQLHVREGDQVQKGQLLLTLDSQKFQASNQQAYAGLKVAQAQVKLAKARLDLARKTHNRQKDLFAKNLASKEAMDAAETEVKVAEASYDAAKDSTRQAAAGVRMTRDELAKATIRSPIDGVVTRLNKEAGEIALGSMFSRDVIMEVSDPEKMIATVEVDEADVVNVEVGDEATIEIDALPNEKFGGVVIEIAGSAKVSKIGTQEETVAFEVKVLLSGDTAKMRPGMSATADIITEVNPEVFQVPIQCITMRDPAVLAKNEEEGDDGAEANVDDKEDEGGVPVSGDISKMKELLFRIDEESVSPLWIETGISSDTHMEITGEGLAEDLQVVCGPFKTLNRLLKPGDSIAIQPGGMAGEKQ